MPTLAPSLPPGTHRDERLDPLRDKVMRGERLSLDEGELLYTTPDIWSVLSMADRVRRRLHGDAAYYNINRHLNYSNVCALSCKFCDFYAKAGEEKAYTRDMDYIREQARGAVESGATEIHSVGGLHPTLPFSYYTDMVSTIDLGGDEVAAADRGLEYTDFASDEDADGERTLDDERVPFVHAHRQGDSLAGAGLLGRDDAALGSGVEEVFVVVLEGEAEVLRRDVECFRDAGGDVLAHRALGRGSGGGFVGRNRSGRDHVGADAADRAGEDDAAGVDAGGGIDGFANGGEIDLAGGGIGGNDYRGEGRGLRAGEVGDVGQGDGSAGGGAGEGAEGDGVLGAGDAGEGDDGRGGDEAAGA